MEAHLEANDLWEVVEEDYEVPHLPNNPTLAQLRSHKEKKARKSKAKASLFAAVSPTIFTRIITMKSTFEIWNFLKNEYEGDERIKGMQVLNLVKEFEMQKMKESETIKEYANKLVSIVNKAPEQRRIIRAEGSVEGALQVKLQINQGEKDKKRRNKKKNSSIQEAAANTSNNEQKNREFPPCKHYGKKGHPPFKCWRRPDVKCDKCNKLGHHERICKSNF